MPIENVTSFQPQGLQRAAQGVPCFGPPDQESRGASRAARILIIEDDYFVALELEHQLTEAGYDVIGVAATAEKALSIADAHKPELAIVDIRLAGLRDGIEAAEQLLREHGIRSIFSTAHSDPLTRKRGEVARPLGWLEKPYLPDALLQLVKIALKA